MIWLKRLAIAFSVLIGLAALIIAIWPLPKYQAYSVSPDYQAQANSYPVAPLPDGWLWDKYTLSEDTFLRFGRVETENAKATLLFVPGYAMSIEMYGDYFSKLQARGYSVISVDLRGQGGSSRHFKKQPERMWVKDFGVYSDDLARFITDLDIPQNQQLLLVGDSFGGHVSFRAVGDHKDLPVDKLALLVPAFELNTGDMSKSTVKTITTIAKLLGKSDAYAMGQNNWSPYTLDLSSSNPCGTHPEKLHIKDVVYAANSNIRVGGPTNNWIDGIIKSGDHILDDDYLKNTTLPMAIINVDDDAYIKAKTANMACTDKIPNCTLVVPEKTRHCILLEREDVMTQILDAFDALLIQ